jgi:hypothetical protein
MVLGKLLIGSRALAYWLPVARSPHDWDILTTDKTCVSGNSIDFYNYDPSDSEILDYSLSKDLPTIVTPIGELRVADLAIVKMLKIGSLPLESPKHTLDLRLLDHVSLTAYETELSVRRQKETARRLQKREFFKPNVHRYIDHDQLHRWIKNPPTFMLILDEAHATNPVKDKFDLLSYEDKRNLLLEEAFVLALERVLVRMVKQQIDHFGNVFDLFTNYKTMQVPLHFVNKVCLPGRLQDHPDFIQEWGFENYNSLTNNLAAFWRDTVNSLPTEFWTWLVAESE